MLSPNREICIIYCTELNQEIAIFSLDRSVASEYIHTKDTESKVP